MASKLDSWRLAAYNAEECLAGCLASPEIAKHLDQATARTILERLSQARIEMLAASEATQPAAGEQVTCRHRLADARNKHIASGYFCVECGAAFAAADHAAPPAAAHGDEAVRKPELVGYFSFCEDKQKWLQQKSKGAEFNHLFTPLYAMRAQGDGEVQ